MTSRIAPLLEPYLTLPEDASLVVLTGILGASTNWLVLRYLSSYLLPPSSPPPPPRPTAPPTEADPAPPAAVLLVSFLRDLPFWRDGASRLGLDLEAAGRQGRFAFVDGLRGLFPGAVAAAPGAAAAWQSALAGASLAHVGRVLHEAADRLREGDGDAARTRAVVLVVDQLDFLLAAAGGAEEEGVGDVSALRVRELLMGLREVSAGFGRSILLVLVLGRRSAIAGVVAAEKRGTDGDLLCRRCTPRCSRCLRTSLSLPPKRRHWNRSMQISSWVWPTKPSWYLVCDC